MIYALIFATLCLATLIGVLVWVLHRVMGALQKVTEMAANPNFEVITPGSEPKTIEELPDTNPGLPADALDWEDMSPFEREKALANNPGFAFAEPGTETPVGESPAEETREDI